MIPITPDMISMVLGGLGGFAMKIYSMKLQNEKDRFDRMMNAIKATDESMDKAARRDLTPAGQATRRIIVLSILFGVILAPFILALFNYPIIVQIDTPVKEHLMGMWSTGGKSLFYELKGYLLIGELRQALLLLISFYFGSSVPKR